MHLIAYHSRSLIAEGDFKTQLNEIYESCARNNTAHAVTGVLLHEGGYFVQLLEGDKNSLDTVMSRISADDRHTDITMFVDEPIDARQFPDWAMETFYLSNPSILRASTLQNLRSIYSENHEMNSRKLVAFLKEMLDQIDIFNIKHG